MKNLTLFLMILVSGILSGQIPFEKYSEQLKSKLIKTVENEKILTWIFFNDKGNYVQE